MQISAAPIRATHSEADRLGDPRRGTSVAVFASAILGGLVARQTEVSVVSTAAALALAFTFHSFWRSSRNSSKEVPAPIAEPVSRAHLLNELRRANRHAEFGAIAALHCLRVTTVGGNSSDGRAAAQSVFDRISREVRHNDPIAMWDEDTILVLQCLVRSVGDARALSQRLSRLATGSINVDDREVRLQTKPSFVVVPADACSPEAIIEMALSPKPSKKQTAGSAAQT